ATVPRHQCYQQGRIDPSRQKRAYRDVADHLSLDSAVKQLLQFVCIWDGCGRVHHWRAPVPFDGWLSVARAPHESATGLKLPHTLENGTRRRNIIERHEIAHGNQVQPVKPI